MRGGHIDVDRILNEIEPRQFDELVAFRKIEPDPDDRLLGVVRRGFQAVLSTMGCEVELKDLDPWYEDPSEETDQDGVVRLLRTRY